MLYTKHPRRCTLHIFSSFLQTLHSPFYSLSRHREAGARGGDGQNCACFTLEMLLRTPSGVTSPTTVTFFVAKSMSYDVTPGQEQPPPSSHFFLLMNTTHSNYHRRAKLCWCWSLSSVTLRVSPSILEICFLTFPSQPLQCKDTLNTTT